MAVIAGLRGHPPAKHAVMRRLLMVALIVLAGCKAHTPPDEAVAARLRAVVEATCVAMALPEADRPTGRLLDDQVGLLAMRLTPALLQEIDSGKCDRAVVEQGYRAALVRRAQRQSRSEPPRLLVFLIDRQPAWTIDQTLLAAALLAQYEHEARLAPPPAELPR
jgi:hypothetical protein